MEQTHGLVSTQELWCERTGRMTSSPTSGVEDEDIDRDDPRHASPYKKTYHLGLEPTSQAFTTQRRTEITASNLSPVLNMLEVPPHIPISQNSSLW